MEGVGTTGSTRRVIDEPYLRRLQRRHFLLFCVLPFLGTATAVATHEYLAVGLPELVVFVLMWLVTGLGISVGFHRLLTHRSFTAHHSMVVTLAILGSMCGQGSVVSWVAMHRRHHELSDREGDMHSPNLHGFSLVGRLRGFLHAHVTWMAGHPYPNVVQYAPDLLRDKALVWVGRRYYTWVALGLLVPSLLCALLRQQWIGLLTGLLWGGVVRMFVLEHFIWALNSLCHMVGTRKYRTRDRSRNIGVLAPLIFGESWHHNHHAFPASAWFGLAWFRPDPGYWFIRGLAFLGLARDVNVPTQDQLRAHSATPGRSRPEGKL